VRTVEASDTDALRRLFFRLSPRTIYLRFFRPVRRPAEATLRYLAGVDHDGREALAAVAGGEIVAVARYDRDPDDPTRAEMAVVVEDEWQGRGLGRLLLELLTVVARRRGIDTLTASVLGENTRMLSLARELAPGTSSRIDHGEWVLDMPLEPA
jgi:GNAT superfamily N-acetyltransferase